MNMLFILYILNNIILYENYSIKHCKILKEKTCIINNNDTINNFVYYDGYIESNISWDEWFEYNVNDTICWNIEIK